MAKSRNENCVDDLIRDRLQADLCDAPDFVVPTDSNFNNCHSVVIEISDGLGGTDTLNGGAGSDTLRGGFGDDLLGAGAGAATILDGKGADRITGSAGGDLLTGGAGAGRYIYGCIGQSALGGLDLIMNFRHETGMIDLIGIDARTNRNGDQAFLFGGQNVNAIANSVTWYELNGNTFVQADVNGDSTADFVVQLSGTGLQLAVTDFGL